MLPRKPLRFNGPVFGEGYTLVTSHATKLRILAQLGDVGFLHFAAYGRLNTLNPLFSTIILSPSENDDGLLNIKEVYDLDLSKTTW